MIHLGAPFFIPLYISSPFPWAPTHPPTSTALLSTRFSYWTLSACCTLHSGSGGITVVRSFLRKLDQLPPHLETCLFSVYCVYPVLVVAVVSYPPWTRRYYSPCSVYLDFDPSHCGSIHTHISHPIPFDTTCDCSTFPYGYLEIASNPKYINFCTLSRYTVDTPPP
jgi:hypothetical protein